MTLRPCDIDPLNDLDLKSDLDLDFLIVPSLHSVRNLLLKQWVSLGRRANGPYATAPVMTSRPCDLDLQNDLDL